MEIENIYDNVDCYEAADLLAEIEIGRSVFLMNDPAICMINGGHTKYGKDAEEGYFHFSRGQNWSDQARTYVSKEKMIELLERALEAVNNDFEKYKYDTEDTNAAYITIENE